MVPWKIIVGIVLFAFSSLVVELLVWGGVSFTLGDKEYAGDICTKVLDVLAGSFLVWGLIGRNVARKTKGAKKNAL